MFDNTDPRFRLTLSSLEGPEKGLGLTLVVLAGTAWPDGTADLDGFQRRPHSRAIASPIGDEGVDLPRIGRRHPRDTGFREDGIEGGGLG